MRFAGFLTFALFLLMLPGKATAQLSFSPLRGAAVSFAPLRGAAASRQPTPTVVDSPTVKVLTGLLAPQFQEEMNFITQALGVTCNTCHAPRGNFASDEKPEKLTARRMLEMTRAINKQFFPDHKPKPNESVLGRVTCYTCHQGERTPKLPLGD